tara:strand:+ start:6506 stop:8368 length:1863 start_codon:yes stop_codon:yes gene_type:complete
MAQKKTIVIEAKDNTKQAFNDVKNNLDGMEKSVKSSTNAMNGLKGALKGAVATLSIGVFASATKSTLDYADALGKTSARLGLTTTNLQTLRFAATQSGMTTEALEMSMQRFTRRLQEAGKGTGVLKDTFKDLGMSIRNTDGTMKSAEVMLGEVADMMAKIPDQGERVRIAFQMFDSEGVKMVNMLQNGSGALDDMRQKLIDTGAIMSEDFIKNSEEANDAIDLLQNQIKAGFGGAISGLAPLIKKFALALGDVILLAKEYPIVTTLAGSVTALGIAFATLGGPVTIALTGLAALIGIGTAIHSEFSETKTELDKVNEGLIESAEKTKNIVKTEKDKFKAMEMTAQQLEEYNAGMLKTSHAQQTHLRNQKEINEQFKEQNKLYGSGAFMSMQAVRVEAHKKETDEIALQNDYLREQHMLYGQGKEGLVETQAMLDENDKKNREREEANLEALKELARESIGTTASTAKATGDILYEQGVVGFETARGLAFAEAMINAHLSATKALASLPAPFGVAAASATYALAFARAIQIKNMEPPKRREFGGSVMSGESYLVGERGAEMFTPSTSGTITPNNQLGASNITFNINATDASGFDQLLIRRKPLIMAMINSAMNNSGKRGLL